MQIRLLLLFFVLLCPLTVFAVPSAPVNAPLAHPLAPNPHTSVGVFWIYTDATTGRQWTGGTYKVKRCTGAACTPTTVVATGLTSADYQDTGLISNTVYGYRYLANDGADSADSPTVYVTTLAADSNFAQFPNADWEEVLGPLAEDAQIPFSWYKTTAATVGQDIISKTPFTLPYNLQGTGSITNGTTTLTGTGTFFREQAAANSVASCANHISINGVDAGTYTINSNTSITLTTTWNGGNQTNVALSTNVPLCGFGDPFSDFYIGNNLYYYDSALADTSIYFRTGDPQYLRGAFKKAESLFTGFIHLGRDRDTDHMQAPRNFQACSLMLLGAAGRTDVWDYMDFWLTNRYPIWVSNYRPANGNNLFNREQGYTVQFASWFVSLAPDSFPRSDGTTTSANGTIIVNGSLSGGRKGHWRDQLNIDVPGLLAAAQSPEGNYRTQGFSGSYSEGDYPYPPGEAQPFMSGLMYDALGFCWRNTDLSTAARESARKQVLKAAANMFLEAYNTNVAADNPSALWRTIWYFLDGGTRLNPYAFRYGADTPILNNTPDNNMITQFRQSIPLMLPTMAWAYEMSGDAKYKTWGDEMANAAFAEIGENTGGTGDGYKCICDASNRKDYGQCYRSSARYFGARLLTPSSLGTAPVVTMPGNQTLINGVNQAELTASVSCTNSPCTYRWSLTKWHLMLGRSGTPPMFSSETSLTTKISGLKSGTYVLVFYALDSLGLTDSGNVTLTVGDGVFPPVITIQKEGGSIWCTTGTSVSAISVRAFSAAGRSLTHVFSSVGPNDQSAPTITPSGTTGNVITVTMSGLSPGWWTMIDTVTDSAGATVADYFVVTVNPTSCGTGFIQPTQAHNTIPSVAAGPNHILPAGSTATRLYVAPRDPEGWSGFANAAPGYTLGPNGDRYMPTALVHLWTQTAGPMTATITNGNTVRPDITNMLQAGTYTFRYSGTDQQGDIRLVSINVAVQGGGPKILRGKGFVKGKVTLQ